MRSLIYSFIIILVFNVNCFPANWYVDKNASGSNNGTSWANAWESFANISMGSLSGGDVVFISGGVESTVYNEGLNITASGTASNPLVFKIGQEAGHNGLAVIVEGGLTVSSESYVTVSGRVGNGTSQHINVRGTSGDEVMLNNITGVIIEYLNVGPCSGDDAVSVDEYVGGGNIIRNCDIHDFFDYGIIVNRPSGDENAPFINDDHLLIQNNEIHNLGHDAIHAAAFAGGLTIDGNHVHTQPDGDGVNYTTTYVDGFHLRGFKYLTVSNNHIHDLWASDGVNAYIFLECDVAQQNSTDAHDMYIYNNVIYETNHSSAASQNSRGIQFKPAACASITNIEISNNTIVDTRVWAILTDWYQISSSNISNVKIINNLMYNNDQRSGGRTDRVTFTFQSLHSSVTTGSVGDSPVPDIIWDYNLVDAFNARATCRYGTSPTSPLISYTDFYLTSGCDAHGVGFDPAFVNWSENAVTDAYDLKLSENDEAAIDAGTPSSIFNNDFSGTIRPLGSRWDIGAFEGASSYVPVPLREPQDLQILPVDDL